jgi:hypothetical protein
MLLFLACRRRQLTLSPDAAYSRPRLRARKELSPKTIHIDSQTFRLIWNKEYEKARNKLAKFHRGRRLSSIFEMDLLLMNICCDGHWIVAIVVRPGLVLNGLKGQSG